MPSKVHVVKTIGFPVVMYGCESWTVKKAECQRIDAFELWCWKRLLRVLCCKENNQSILKKISPEYSSEGLMLKLKLKLQYFGHLTQRAKSLEETLMRGKIECGRRGQQRTRWLDDGHEFEQAPGDGGGQGSLACWSPWGCKESDTTEWLNNNNNQGLNPRRLHWKSGVLTPGPPGRSLNSPFL